MSVTTVFMLSEIRYKRKCLHFIYETYMEF